MHNSYSGDILAVRAVEDCIRATKKYTKGAFSRPVKHPIQGEEFPSRVLTEYYEVYPDFEISWDTLAADAWAWIWGDAEHIDILFKYNYPVNRAWVIIHGGNGVIKDLERGIPGMKEALSNVSANGKDSR